MHISSTITVSTAVQHDPAAIMRYGFTLFAPLLALLPITLADFSSAVAYDGEKNGNICDGAAVSVAAAEQYSNSECVRGGKAKCFRLDPYTIEGVYDGCSLVAYTNTNCSAPAAIEHRFNSATTESSIEVGSFYIAC